MSDKKQTAVEWLTEKLWSEFRFAFSNNILEQAKELEKQQIIEAAKFVPAISSTKENCKSAEQYYSQTYNQ